MKRDLREMIGNELILNSPAPPYSLVYSIFVDDTYVLAFLHLRSSLIRTYFLPFSKVFIYLLVLVLTN